MRPQGLPCSSIQCQWMRRSENIYLRSYIVSSQILMTKNSLQRGFTSQQWPRFGFNKANDDHRCLRTYENRHSMALGCMELDRTEPRPEDAIHRSPRFSGLEELVSGTNAGEEDSVLWSIEDEASGRVSIKRNRSYRDEMEWKYETAFVTSDWFLTKIHSSIIPKPIGLAHRNWLSNEQMQTLVNEQHFQSQNYLSWPPTVKSGFHDDVSN